MKNLRFSSCQGAKVGHQGPQGSARAQACNVTTNSTHIWCQHQDLSPGHIDGRRVLPPLRHPLLPILFCHTAYELSQNYLSLAESWVASCNLVKMFPMVGLLGGHKLLALDQLSQVVMVAVTACTPLGLEKFAIITNQTSFNSLWRNIHLHYHCII